ncbi:MAG TPA: c-type cytochrome [Roseateles sp.]
MSLSNFVRSILLVSGCAGSGWAAAADRPDPGRREFMNSCAACHGADAKGYGPLGASLKQQPADLTVLSQKNGGVFPMERVQQVIDGRAGVKTHGTREMPVWGERFANLCWAECFEEPFDADAYVAARVLLLADYLNRVQVK